MIRPSWFVLALVLAPASLVSQTPTYDGYRRTSEYLTMRDGIRLAVDVLRPTKAGVLHEGKLPVVWTHHRYNRAW